MKTGHKDNMTTGRLLLRAIAASDREAVLDIFSDEETMRYWSREPIASLAEADALIEKELEWAALDTCINWGIALAETGLLIGKITLFQINEQNRRAEVGYLLNRRYWGKGYMTEAMACVVSWAFDELELHRIEADTDPENLPSLALLDRFGFIREGLFRDRWYVHGKWHDSIMLGLLKKNLKFRPNPI